MKTQIKIKLTMTTFWYSNLGKNSPLFFVVFSFIYTKSVQWGRGKEVGERAQDFHKNKNSQKNSIYLHWLFTGFRCTFTALFTFWEIVFLCLQLFFICSFSRLFDFLYPIFSYFFFWSIEQYFFFKRQTHTHTHTRRRERHSQVYTQAHTHQSVCLFTSFILHSADFPLHCEFLTKVVRFLGFGYVGQEKQGTNANSISLLFTRALLLSRLLRPLSQLEMSAGESESVGAVWPLIAAQRHFGRK